MGRAATFDLGDVERAGLAVAADQGWAAVSMRSVADQVGVSTMALYRLVPDAPALRRTIADAAAVAPVVRPDDDVLDALARWAPRGFRRLVAHPGLATFVVAEWTELPRWLDVVEALLARAVADGRDGNDAVATVNAVFAYVLARAQFRERIVAAEPRHLAPTRADPGRYPNILRNRPAFATARTIKHFHVGLDALLAGLAAERPSGRRPDGQPAGRSRR